MKKLLISILSGIIAISLFGCNTSKEVDAEKQERKIKQEKHEEEQSINTYIRKVGEEAVYNLSQLFGIIMDDVTKPDAIRYHEWIEYNKNNNITTVNLSLKTYRNELTTIRATQEIENQYNKLKEIEINDKNSNPEIIINIYTIQENKTDDRSSIDKKVATYTKGAFTFNELNSVIKNK